MPPIRTFTSPPLTTTLSPTTPSKSINKPHHPATKPATSRRTTSAPLPLASYLKQNSIMNSHSPTKLRKPRTFRTISSSSLLFPPTRARIEDENHERRRIEPTQEPPVEVSGASLAAVYDGITGRGRRGQRQQRQREMTTRSTQERGRRGTVVFTAFEMVRTIDPMEMYKENIRPQAMMSRGEPENKRSVDYRRVGGQLEGLEARKEDVKLMVRGLR